MLLHGSGSSPERRCGHQEEQTVQVCCEFGANTLSGLETTPDEQPRATVHVAASSRGSELCGMEISEDLAMTEESLAAGPEFLPDSPVEGAGE
jgi:hypothetical protein